MHAYLTGTGRRLVVAFALLIAVFGVASFVAARAIDHVNARLHDVRNEEERVRTVLQLANAVRDQYAHQAHIILLRNDTHLHMYEDAREKVAGLTGELLARSGASGHGPDIREIEAASEEMDRVFRAYILPAVRGGDEAAARSAHDEALDLVLRVQQRADDLASTFETAIAASQEQAQRVQQTTYRWALAFFIGGLLLSAVVALWIARSVARPVAVLEAGAARLAQGDLGTRIRLERRDEFGRLAAQFNAMTEALEAHQAELLRSERLAGIGRLAAGVAHEINNPLGVILGYVRLLEKRAPEELHEDLSVIDQETVRAKEIVEGLLDLSRPWEIGAEPVDLRELAERGGERLKESGVGDGVDIRVEGTAAAPGNARALHQVLANLIRNAVEAAGPEGVATVRLSQTEDEARVDVEDTGPGLSAEARERLYEPFFTSKPTGTGLGLAVSRAIVQAHGGRIEVVNPPEGGARFTVVLPSRGTDASPAQSGRTRAVTG